MFRCKETLSLCAYGHNSDHTHCHSCSENYTEQMLCFHTFQTLMTAAHTKKCTHKNSVAGSSYGRISSLFGFLLHLSLRAIMSASSAEFAGLRWFLEDGAVLAEHMVRGSCLRDPPLQTKEKQFAFITMRGQCSMIISFYNWI